MKIFDAHTHLFPTEIIGKRKVIAKKEKEFQMLYEDKEAVMVDGSGLETYMNTQGIESLIAYGFPFRDRGILRLSNDYILEVANKNRRIIPFACVNMDDSRGAPREAERCLSLGAQGLGELALYSRCLDTREIKKLEPIARIAEDYNVPLTLHVNEQIGHAYRGKARMDFNTIVDFITHHRNLTIILAHLGGGLAFYEFMPEIQDAFMRVYYDTAAIPLVYTQGIYRFIEEHLADKVLFGSDYPLLSAGPYIRDMAHLQAKTKKRLLYNNAQKLFGHGGLG